MKAVLLDHHLQLVDDFPQPQPQPGEALIRIHQAGICNTDVELLNGYKNFTGVPGHEFVGTVAAGPDEWLGRRVVGEINVACGACDMCQRGIPTQCRHRRTLGLINHQGAFAEYLALSTANLHAVPDALSDDQAVFVEPLAAACQILEATSITSSDRVVLVGAGKLGLLCAQVLHLTGADLKVVVRRERPRQLLEKWGIAAVTRAELPDNMADVVVDCTGSSEGFTEALSLVRPRGRIVLKSTYAHLPTADLTRVVVDEIQVIGSRCGPFPTAIGLLARGEVDVVSLIEERYVLKDAVAAFARASQPGMGKVLLTMQAIPPAAE
jgi:threonine dehydrogenase-like Zn-dependent dehydrogenase